MLLPAAQFMRVGVGAVPDAILRQIGDRKDLGVHSGMLGDGLVDLIESGARNGAPKYMEWYSALGLLVTLIWLYLEILRLLAKLSRRN